MVKYYDNTFFFRKYNLLEMFIVVYILKSKIRAQNCMARVFYFAGKKTICKVKKKNINNCIGFWYCNIFSLHFFFVVFFFLNAGSNSSISKIPYSIPPPFFLLFLKPSSIWLWNFLLLLFKCVFIF